MPDITLTNRIIYDANVGAMLCRTPKTPGNELVDDVLVDRRCTLVSSVDEFLYYFGDPFINPTEYSDAIIALDLVKRNIPMYISSIDEMKHNDDGFSVPYNGYTEFYFLDEDKFRSIGYKLKSDMKFCQPIIQSELNLNILTIRVSLFVLDRSELKHGSTIVGAFDPSRGNINTFDPLKLYITYTADFDVSKVKNSEGKEVTSTTDDDLISMLSTFGLELQTINTFGKSDLIDKLCEYSKFTVTNDQSKHVEEYSISVNGHDTAFYRTLLDYEYDLHTDDYAFDFSDDDKVINTYRDAALRIRTVLRSPLFLSLGRLYKSYTTLSGTGDSAYIERSVMCDLDPYNYSVVHYHLLSMFDPAGTRIDVSSLREVYSDASNTYLFISAPDMSAAAAIKWLASTDQFSSNVERPDQYNCDMFYGYVTEYVVSSMAFRHPQRTLISAATLAMYNSLLNGAAYMTNELTSLNIANASVKTHILESTARKMANARCNSVVLFDRKSPSIYGNRSLSTLPNLRYSHISRNFILIRRLIYEYLETKKFVLNTVYETDMCVNYVSKEILDQFKINGVLRDYSIEKSSSKQTVYITTTLYFNQMAGHLQLDFTI